ncbi:hypothetical protein [Rhizobium ruizarguesonis]|uniref:hypothetical protein n=1 Tax=Rhizobium ruizarguesonis TaxID=2081791 RepID=UPI0013EE57AA|nr:hypothetical protein [Rhizobium ruizarguesonis]
MRGYNCFGASHFLTKDPLNSVNQPGCALRSEIFPARAFAKMMQASAHPSFSFHLQREIRGNGQIAGWSNAAPVAVTSKDQPLSSDSRKSKADFIAVSLLVANMYGREFEARTTRRLNFDPWINLMNYRNANELPEP